MSPAKMAEWSEMPFGWVTLVGLSNHIGSRSPKGKGLYLGVVRYIERRCESVLQYTQQ